MDKSCKDRKERFSTCEDLDDNGRHGNEGVGVREIAKKGLVQQHVLCS